MSNLDRSIGPYKWPTWCVEEKKKKKKMKRKKKTRHFSANTRNARSSNKIPFFSERSRSGARRPPARPQIRGAPGLRGRGGVCSAPYSAVLCCSVPSRAELCQPCLDPGANKATANCRWMGFGGPLCTPCLSKRSYGSKV